MNLLTKVNFKKAVPAWVALLDIPQDQVAKAAASRLGEKLKGDSTALIELVSKATETDAEDTRHKGGRLPAVISNAEPNVAYTLSKKLLPMLLTQNEVVSNQTIQYLRLCQAILVKTELWPGWLKLILEFYKGNERVRPKTEAFLAGIRDTLNPQKRADLWEILMASKEEEHGALLENLVSKAPSPAGMMAEILDMVIQDRVNWGPAKVVLDGISAEVCEQALAESLEKGWQYSAWNYLVQESPERAAGLARRVIPDPQYTLPTRHRAHVIEDLGRIGTQDDAAMLLEYLSSEKKEIRRAAARALGGVGNQDAEKHLRETLRDDYAAVVEAAIQSLHEVAIPEADTVHRLRERALEDPNKDMRRASEDAIEALLGKHLGREEIDDVVGWLETLRAFGRSDCGDRLEDLLGSIRFDESQDLRAQIATTIGVCCKPSIGLEIIDRRLNEEPLERNPEVRRALEAAQDELSASPDMALLRLLNELTDTELSREDLLGDFSFGDLFTRPNTIAHLRAQMPKAIKAKRDPDTFVTRLDGIASVIGDEVEDALTQQFPQTADPKGRRGYASQIEFMGRAGLDLKHAASALHDLREKSDLPHVEDDKSGQTRPGCDAQDEADARRHFQVIVKEALNYLRNRRDEKSSEGT